MVWVHINDLIYGNRLFESRLEQYAQSNETDEYLIAHMQLSISFNSRDCLTFKIQDGNHAFHELCRRNPNLEFINFQESQFQDGGIEKYCRLNPEYQELDDN